MKGKEREIRAADNKDSTKVANVADVRSKVWERVEAPDRRGDGLWYWYYRTQRTER